MARPHGDAVDRELAESVDERCRVIVATRARARDHDQQIAPSDRAQDRVSDPRFVVGLDRQHDDLAPGLAGLAGEHQGVGLEQLAALELRGADRAHLVAGRKNRHHRLPVDVDLGGAGGGGRGDVDRAQAVTGGEEQLGGADVLADRARVLVGRDRRAELSATVDVVHVLAHDDGVEVAGQWIAGIDDDELVPREEQRRALARADGLAGPDGNSVHRRRVERRRGPRGPDRVGGDAADRPLERQPDRLEPGRAARGGAAFPPLGLCARERNVAEERGGAASHKGSRRPARRRTGRSRPRARSGSRLRRSGPR